MDDVAAQASNHFGQPYLNSATVVGLFRMTLKKLAKIRGKELVSVEEVHSTPRNSLVDDR